MEPHGLNSERNGWGTQHSVRVKGGGADVGFLSFPVERCSSALSLLAELGVGQGAQSSS